MRQKLFVSAEPAASVNIDTSEPVPTRHARHLRHQTRPSCIFLQEAPFTLAGNCTCQHGTCVINTPIVLDGPQRKLRVTTPDQNPVYIQLTSLKSLKFELASGILIDPLHPLASPDSRQPLR